MPFYIKQGKIPAKRHITFYRDDGELYREELFSTHGFSNIYSNKYHYNMPTKVLRVEPYEVNHGEEWHDAMLQNYKVHTFRGESSGNFFTARRRQVFNNDVALYTAKVTEDTSDFYRNAYADEVVFVHEGTGTLTSEYGNLDIQKY